MTCIGKLAAVFRSGRIRTAQAYGHCPQSRSHVIQSSAAAVSQLPSPQKAEIKQSPGHVAVSSPMPGSQTPSPQTPLARQSVGQIVSSSPCAASHNPTSNHVKSTPCNSSQSCTLLQVRRIPGGLLYGYRMRASWQAKVNSPRPPIKYRGSN